MPPKRKAGRPRKEKPTERPEAMKPKINRPPSRKPPPKKITIDEENQVVGEGVFDFDMGNLTAKSAEMYKNKKNAKITSLELFRRPVEDALTGVMDLFSGNAVSKYFKNTSHDKLFHLGLIINGKFLYHKQANITIEQMPRGFKKNKKLELKPVTGFDKNITFKDMYRRTRERVGEKRFYEYDSFKQNCQDFIVDNLDTIGATYDKAWVKQDVKEIVKKSPNWFPSLAKALTDFGSVAEKITGGSAPAAPPPPPPPPGAPGAARPPPARRPRPNLRINTREANDLAAEEQDNLDEQPRTPPPKISKDKKGFFGKSIVGRSVQIIR